MADSDELSLAENGPEIETVLLQEPPAKKQLAVPMLLGQPTANKNPHAKPFPINNLMDRLNLPRVKINGMNSLVWSISERGFSKYTDPNLDHLVVCICTEAYKRNVPEANIYAIDDVSCRHFVN